MYKMNTGMFFSALFTDDYVSAVCDLTFKLCLGGFFFCCFLDGSAVCSFWRLVRGMWSCSRVFSEPPYCGLARLSSRRRRSLVLLSTDVSCPESPVSHVGMSPGSHAVVSSLEVRPSSCARSQTEARAVSSGRGFRNPIWSLSALLICILRLLKTSLPHAGETELLSMPASTSDSVSLSDATHPLLNLTGLFSLVGFFCCCLTNVLKCLWLSRWGFRSRQTVFFFSPTECFKIAMARLPRASHRWAPAHSDSSSSAFKRQRRSQQSVRFSPPGCPFEYLLIYSHGALVVFLVVFFFN